MFDSIAESTRTPNPPGALYLVIMPGQGRKLFRIFGVDAAFEAVPVELDVLLFEREGVSIGEPDLLLDQIDAGHHFGDGMLDLDAGVHFHEEEVVVLVEQELDGADISVVNGFDGFDGNATDFSAEFLVDGR